MAKRILRFGCLVAPIVSALFSGGAAVAGDEGLYPPPPPPGAGSVRVVDIRSAPQKDTLSVGGKSLVAMGAPGRFVYVQQGVSDLKAPNYSTSTNIEAGQYYSVLVGNKISILYREPRPPLTQSLVVLYNLSSLSDVSVKTEDGTTTVVSSLKAFRVGKQAVNPLNVGFSVYAGQKKLGVVSAVQLKRWASLEVA